MEVSCFSLLFSPDVRWSNSSEMLLHSSLFLLVKAGLVKQEYLQQQQSRGFAFQICCQEEKQQQNWTRKGFGMRVVTCPGWQDSDVGNLGGRVQSIGVCTGCSCLHSPARVTSHPLKTSFHDEEPCSFTLQNWSGGNMKNFYNQFMTVLYLFF